MTEREITVGRLDELGDPDCREFTIGEGDWPFRGFVVRRGDSVYAYQNYCMHVGHQLNWKPDSFLTRDMTKIICASHGALYEIDSGLCVGGPCRGKSLRRVACELREGWIVVRRPDSA
ncbi:MAG: Rieske 2Fe-2S domain-containing protein [Gammaproteobacteria bacterium]|nr:Rieske 2Fe-2S domain-containing protein [Gammaproteobacteria bacterium]MDH4253740.1 Rieske 2Fe-2S domain-containing protein [Gammaproteobacteria bacterium]MDH5309669.1 Rieske 2Fe-2S domain-containing protein [Gammaproteobacteria bacterium]